MTLVKFSNNCTGHMPILTEIYTEFQQKVSLKALYTVDYSVLIFVWMYSVNFIQAVRGLNQTVCLVN